MLAMWHRFAGQPYNPQRRSWTMESDADEWATGVFEVTVTGRFAATHQLRRPDGSYEPLHAHEWNVKVTYSGQVLDEMGVLIDFGPLRSRLDALVAALNGRILNELPPFSDRNPSAEHVALYLANELVVELPGAARLVCVEVEEEPGCFARYHPPHDTQRRRPCG